MVKQRHQPMSALLLIADSCSALVHDRFGPIADIHSSAPTKRETPGNCPGSYCISRSGYVESAWAFRQASARAKRKARTYLRGTGSSLQRFIGDIERKCFFFILYRVVHHGIDPFVRRFHPSASYYYWNSVVGRNRIIDIFILRVYPY